MELMGRRLPDTRITELPLPYDDLLASDYWLVKCREEEGDRLMDVHAFPDDRRYWGAKDGDPRYAGNLTGLVLGCMDPLRNYGMLSIHTVRLEDDGTVSVRAGDGSSNSILIKRRTDEPWFHGFIEHGKWHGGIEGPA